MERTLRRRSQSSRQRANRKTDRERSLNSEHRRVRRRRHDEEQEEFAYKSDRQRRREEREEMSANSQVRLRHRHPERQRSTDREEYRSRRHRRGPSVRWDEEESYRASGRSMFGEHPASRGKEEYAGSNKRHPGLLGQRSQFQKMNIASTKNEEGLMRKLDDERLYRLGRKKRPRNHHNSTRLRISDYEHRQQFGTPFHPMQMYDPIESEYKKEELDELMDDDHIYRYEGYQRSGNTEGFGSREGSRQQGNDWLDEDEYREGHAPRYRGYGKYGSR